MWKIGTVGEHFLAYLGFRLSIPLFYHYSFVVIIITSMIVGGIFLTWVLSWTGLFGIDVVIEDFNSVFTGTACL